MSHNVFPPLLVALAASASLVMAPMQAGAQTHGAIDVEAAPRPEALATRATTPVVVDGVLDEAAWAAAPVLGGLIQARPDRGMPATEDTEIRILYDDRTLYIGVELHDSEPNKLVIPSLEQDFESGNSDIFGITLDTFHDRRNAFMFLVNPKGAVKEAQDFDDSRQENAAWEGIFEVRTRIDDGGWTVEWAIPFTTLRFDPSIDPQTWGMNMMRRIRRKNEESYWAPLDQRDRIHKMSKAGTLSGLHGLRSGRNLIVKPYVVASHANGAAPGTSSDWSQDGGLDIKYGVTPRLTLDATWRTDFSQVEVDQEQVNLTRFGLFFPERRDFFTENSGVFSFGDISERTYRSGSSLSDFTLFHSRRIGLDGAGHPVPIIGGGRLTGRAGGFEIGALDMQTRSAQGLPAENFTVLRGKRTVEGVGDFGGIFVSRQATDGSGSYNRTYGVEANLAPSRYLRIDSYLSKVDDATATGSDWAGRLWVGWRDPFWDLSASVKRIGDGFIPRVGFVRRRGVRQEYGTVGVHARPASIPWLNEVSPFTEVEYTTDLNGRLLSRNLTGSVDVGFRDGGSFGLDLIEDFERLDTPFAVRSDAVVPVGDYTFRTARISAGTSAGRALWARASLANGGFYGGDRTTLSLSGQWRVDYHLSFDFSAERNTVSLPGAEDFAANVYGLRTTLGVTTRLFASAFMQYNALSDEVVTNVRVNYIHASLSDLFLVYTERRDRSGVMPADRLLSLKVTKAVAF